ncbi:MAG TPA: hypothetical protein VEW95_09260 [Candidatus Limnocylindrales bacterium]|nr:hypothetical protein [Candidatus Limnocylindrales bacterium]
MGADGHVQMIPVGRIPEQFADLDPTRLNWSRRDLYGTEVWWSYWDTEGRGELWDVEFWEVPRRIENLQEELRRRDAGEPARYERGRSSDLLNADLQRLGNNHTAEQLAEATRYDELHAWLEANADDWQVWT